MLEKALLKKVLDQALSKGGDFAEIFWERKTKNTIHILNDKVEGINHGVVSGIGLRVYDKLQSYYGYSNDLSEEALLALANRLSQGINRDRQINAIDFNEISYTTINPIKIEPASVDTKDKIALMQRGVKAAFDYDEHIEKVVADYMDEVQDVVVCNSEGKYVSDRRVRTRMFIDVIASDGDLRESGRCAPGGSAGFEFYESNPPEEIGKEAARIAMVMLYADDCPAKVMEAIIDNGFGGVIFHEACGHSLEAAAVAKGQSVFCGKLNQQIANPCVTAIDDGTIPNAWGSANIDDEGNFTKRNVLIENGILKSYMIDTFNGRRMKMPSTSSSRRESYKYETTSRMTNTFIAPGNDSFDEMIKATKEGIYAKSLGGGSVNPVTGDFNFAVNEGYYVKDGKIVKPVKGATLIGNGAEILMNIDMIGSNLKRSQGMCGASSGSIPTDVGQPTIHVSAILVGGKDHE